MVTVRFADAEGKRVRVTGAQAKRIEGMYADIAKDIRKKIRYYEKHTSGVSGMRLMYLRNLAAQIQDRLEGVNREIRTLVEDDMLDVSKTVVNDNERLLLKMGFKSDIARGAYSYVPADAVAEISSGKLYEGRWSLSQAIWDNMALEKKDIEHIVARGLAANKTTFEIAKDLERYVDPAAKKSWDWSKVYPGSKKKIDYNAQRLARTMISHAYQESFVRVTRYNPFVTKYRWMISNSDRVCPICLERNGNLYDKDKLPLDHPNGMCTFEAVIEDSLPDIADNLAEWVRAPNGTFPSIDKFVDDIRKRYDL